MAEADSCSEENESLQALDQNLSGLEKTKFIWAAAFDLPTYIIF